MSHFDIIKELNDVQLDGPSSQTGNGNGPGGASTSFRWQRKSSEDRVGVSPLKTKVHTPGKSINTTTPGKNGKAKTPGSRSTKKTPSNQADRFIPRRANLDLEFAHYALMNKDAPEENQDGDNDNSDYSNQLAKAMNCNDQAQILKFNYKPPDAARSAGGNLRVLYNTNKCSSKNPTTNRHIPSKPERILDAPDLVDDYYLNLLDWSDNNILTVALGQTVYLWNGDTATIDRLMDLSTPDDYVSSVSWLQEGNILAVGLSNGSIQLWDTDQTKLLRSMAGHSARVGCLSWNRHILSSGSRSGAIHHHDVRVPQHHVASLQNHSQEVCGLRWSPNGRYLASGGNDNLVNIWSNQFGATSNNLPVYSFTQHRSAVKALSWCPWQPYLLATGGGSADRQILMWNVQSGANVGTTATDSQVCSLLWSKEHKEIISGHGYASNHLRIWKYPAMSKVVDLVGHTARILCMAMSPDGTTVASTAGDETIRLWKCFDVDKTKKKAAVSKTTDKMMPALAKCIR